MQSYWKGRPLITGRKRAVVLRRSLGGGRGARQSGPCLICCEALTVYDWRTERRRGWRRVQMRIHSRYQAISWSAFTRPGEGGRLLIAVHGT
jgi:hypothetical protein